VSAQGRWRGILWKWLAPVAGVAALAVAVYLYFHTPRQATVRLKITAGNQLGTRAELAEVLHEAAAGRGVVLDLRETVGSEQALDWVETRQVDLALVQGGLSVRGRGNVREAAALQIEPLHLLVKKELAEAVTTHLTALDGRTVNDGEMGTGTHTLAVQVLEFAGLRARADGSGRGYIPMPMGRQQMLAENDARLPDAVFVLSSLPSRLAQELVTRHGYRLVPLPFGEAFALGSLTDLERRARAEDGGLDKGRTFATTIPAFTYGVEPPVPPQPLPTLGNRLILVAHKDVAPQAVHELIGAIYSSQFAEVVRPPLDPRLIDMPPEFPWHNGALLYQERNKPLVSGAVMDSTHKALAIAAAALSGLFVVWQWLKLRAESGVGAEFKRYIQRVTHIEEQALRVESGQPGDVGRLRALGSELTQLKAEALGRFVEGELKGKELMAALLAHVADARDLLTRLIAVEHDRCQGVRHEPLQAPDRDRAIDDGSHPSTSGGRPP
jgi:TRAP-type uncharacterized transport system substrate-binding protein